MLFHINKKCTLDNSWKNKITNKNKKFAENLIFGGLDFVFAVLHQKIKRSYLTDQWKIELCNI